MSADRLPPPQLLDQHISPSLAWVCALLYPILYVAPFYLSATLRTTALAHRDAPAVIKARVNAVALTCLACTLITTTILATLGHASPATILHLLGLYPLRLVDPLRALLLTSILFMGPLYETLIVDGAWRDLSPVSLQHALWHSWPGYRNLVIAPLSEELVFRALVIPLHLLAGIPAPTIILTTPLIFGLAHAHHLVELVRARTPPSQPYPSLATLALSLLQVAFMFAYTSLFGFFAAFLFLRTGSLWPAVAAHSFCNWQGFPRVAGRVGRSPSVDGEWALAWTVVYYALLPVGALGFYVLLWPLTESPNALVQV